MAVEVGVGVVAETAEVVVETDLVKTVVAAAETALENPVAVVAETESVAESHLGEQGIAELKTVLDDFAQIGLQKTVAVEKQTAVVVEVKTAVAVEIGKIAVLVVESVDYFDSGQISLKFVQVVVEQEKLLVALASLAAVGQEKFLVAPA